METKIIKNENNNDPYNPMNLLAMAVKQDIDVTKLEKLMDLQERWEANKAKKAFNEAMTEFQGECPVIVKSKDGGKTNSGNVAYRYAPLDEIVAKTKVLIQKYGFSYLIKAETLEKGISATCIAKHKLGHSEESSITVPLGTKTNVMSDSQVVMAAMTFAKRYAFCNAFGIMTGDQDRDGKVVKGVEEKQKSNFEILKEQIQKMNLLDLHGYKETIAKSEKYTPAQKEKILQVVEARITEIKPQ